MQETSQSIPHWAFEILQGLALFVGGGTIVRMITLYQNRAKPKAEVHESEARAAEINVRSVGKLLDRLELALNEVDRLRAERNKAIDDCAQVRDQLETVCRKLSTQETELKLADEQMKRMDSILKLKGIKLSDYDEPK